MARRAEDAFRRMFGMPSRKEEQRRRRQNGRQNRHSDRFTTSSSPSHQYRGNGVNAMKEYAEDVAYTEIKEYSSNEFDDANLNQRQRRIYREKQVTDAEFVEIKTKK